MLKNEPKGGFIQIVEKYRVTSSFVNIWKAAHHSAKQMLQKSRWRCVSTDLSDPRDTCHMNDDIMWSSLNVYRQTTL